MFIAVLYDDNGQLVAAAPACEENGQGDQYWSNLLHLPLSNRSLGETGTHKVTDSRLAQALLNLQNEPESLPSVQRQWQMYLTASTRATTNRFPAGRKPGSKVVMPKAA